jgi:hypothetical protein
LYFFKYFPFSALTNFSPSNSSKIYALPDTHWLMRYGPSQVGDHFPYFGSLETIGNTSFQTRSPLANTLILTLLSYHLAILLLFFSIFSKVSADYQQGHLILLPSWLNSHRLVIDLVKKSFWIRFLTLKAIQHHDHTPVGMVTLWLPHGMPSCTPTMLRKDCMPPLGIFIDLALEHSREMTSTT